VLRPQPITKQTPRLTRRKFEFLYILHLILFDLADKRHADAGKLPSTLGTTAPSKLMLTNTPT